MVNIWTSGFFQQIKIFDHTSAVNPYGNNSFCQVVAAPFGFPFPPSLLPCPVINSTHAHIVSTNSKDTKLGFGEMLVNETGKILPLKSLPFR